MIIDCYDIETEPIISLKEFYGEQKHIVDVCLIIFSQEIHAHLLRTYECEEIAHFTACNGNIPIYKMKYKGALIAFYLTAIGSACAVVFRWITELKVVGTYIKFIGIFFIGWLISILIFEIEHTIRGRKYTEKLKEYQNGGKNNE